MYDGLCPISPDAEYDGTIYMLVDKDVKLREIDAWYVHEYFDNGYATYFSATEAEQGRQNGDAYDEPGKTRVVGIKIMPFIPKKAKKHGKSRRKETK